MDQIDYSKTDFSATGPVSHHLSGGALEAPAQPVWPSPPDGRALKPGYRWHEVLGEIPENMPGWDIHVAVQRHEAAERQRPQREAQLAEARQREAAEAERSRPRTDQERIEALEARCTALEAKIERLMTPTHLASRSRPKASRTVQEGGDLPPAA